MTDAGQPAASVLVVDDHAALVDPLTMALRASGFDPVIAADVDDLGLDAVLAMALSIRPDVVLLDLHLGRDGLRLPMIEPLVQLGARVLLFTSSDEPRLLAAGLRAGAEAVVNKATPFHRLVGSLVAVARGEQLLADEERSALLEVLEAHVEEEATRLRPFEALTPREAEVLRALIDGRSPKEVARGIGLSVSTVRNHIDRVLTKLDVSSQREALAKARAAGWPP